MNFAAASQKKESLKLTIIRKRELATAAIWPRVACSNHSVVDYLLTKNNVQQLGWFVFYLSPVVCRLQKTNPECHTLQAITSGYTCPRSVSAWAQSDLMMWRAFALLLKAILPLFNMQQRKQKKILRINSLKLLPLDSRNDQIIQESLE